MVAKQEGDLGRDGLGVQISRCKVLYIEWVSNKVLLCSTGNYIQYPVLSHNEKQYEKEHTCIYN